MKRIGHKGAALIEAGNTIASFEAARVCQVDMIEFDVIRWEGKLVCAHDPTDAQARSDTLLTLDEGLDYLAREDFAKIDLDVDLKHQGYELELLDALEQRGLTKRTMITTMHAPSLVLIRAHDPTVKLGLTIPKVNRDWLNVSRPVKVAVAGGVVGHRLFQPGRVSALLRSGAIDAVMAFHAVVTPRLVTAVHDAGGELYSWTVDDPLTMTRLVNLGVDGIVSNDPRLFEHALAEPAPAPI
ncbi:MAG TPA: glycerophosphodiester phosphodiesterase [Solirubrobacterales bacterium]|nr:glycerophosphodiester phosphodiesterase [Solirubrobacterales bacterium]